jgi:uncharacterized membrane protein
MIFNKTTIQIVLTFVLFTLIDFLYLFNMKNTFSSMIQKIQGTKLVFQWIPSLLCYIALVFGLWYFIIREKKSILDAALLGWTIYAVYETTNLAILSKWDPIIALIDVLCGGILFATTTWIIYFLSATYLR